MTTLGSAWPGLGHNEHWTAMNGCLCISREQGTKVIGTSFGMTSFPTHRHEHGESLYKWAIKFGLVVICFKQFIFQREFTSVGHSHWFPFYSSRYIQQSKSMTAIEFFVINIMYNIRDVLFTVVNRKSLIISQLFQQQKRYSPEKIHPTIAGSWVQSSFL